MVWVWGGDGKDGKDGKDGVGDGVGDFWLWGGGKGGEKNR